MEDDAEFLVRRIVEVSDINVMTKRMVRGEYLKLKGQTALTKAEKHAVNSAVDVIIKELVQKGQLAATVSNANPESKSPKRQLAPGSGRKTSTDEKENISTSQGFKNVPSAISELFPEGNAFESAQDVCENEENLIPDASVGTDNMKLLQQLDSVGGGRNERPPKHSPQKSKSFVLNQSRTYTYSNVTEANGTPEKHKKMKSKQMIFAESEAMAAVLDSDFSIQSLDTSDSEVYFTSQKKRGKDRDAHENQTKAQRDVKLTEVPKKTKSTSKSLKEVKSNSFSGLRRKTESQTPIQTSCRLKNHRSVYDLSSDTEDQSLMKETGNTKENYTSSLNSTNRKCSPYEEEERHLLTVKKPENIQSRRRICSSDSETCESPNKTTNPDADGSDTEFGKNVTLISDEKTLGVGGNTEASLDDVTLTESCQNQAGGKIRQNSSEEEDNYSIYCLPSKKRKIKNKKRFKKISSKILDSSDTSDSDSGSSTTLAIGSSFKCRKYGKSASVSIKVVDLDDSSVEEIKETAANADDYIEDLEGKIAKKRLTWKKNCSKSVKSKSQSVERITGADRRKTKGRQECVAIDSDSSENRSCVKLSKLSPVKCSDSSDSEGDDGIDSDCTDIADVGNWKSVSKDALQKSLKVEMTKVDLTKLSRTVNGNYSANMSEPKCEIGRQKNQSVKTSQTSRKRRIVVASDSDASRISDIDSLSDGKHSPAKKRESLKPDLKTIGRRDHTPQDRIVTQEKTYDVYKISSSTCDEKSDNGDPGRQAEVRNSPQEISSSSLSDLSDCSMPDRSVHSTKTEQPAVKKKVSRDSSELTHLRKICRAVGLILRYTKELAGCDTDKQKVARIKSLLKEKGMKGRPSMKKAEKLNLLKEMNELQSCDITSNIAGCRRRTKNLFDNRECQPSERRASALHEDSRSIFSDLQDVITVDDSDSAWGGH